MSRSGYSEDCENLELYRAAVGRALHGKRGQAFLRELGAAMDAMPDKVLIAGELVSEKGILPNDKLTPPPLAGRVERKRKREIMSKTSNVESGAAVAGAAHGSDIEVGKTYKLHHCRFGNATVKILSVTAINDEYKPYLPIDAWIDTEVVSGVLQGINDEWHPGDQKTLRQSHCTFSPNNSSAQTR